MSCNQAGLKEKICAFLKKKKEGSTAIQIAKAVGCQTAKDVNSALYSLKDEGRLHKIQDTPPLWSVNSPERSRTPEVRPDNTKNEVRRLLTSKGGGTGIKSSHIARELAQPKKVVTKVLYDLQRMGQAEKVGENVWKTSAEAATDTEAVTNAEAATNAEANFRGKPIQFKSDYQDISIHLTESSRFSKDFELLTVLGAGGFGCVTKARHREDGKEYAVKIVKRTSVASREVKALADLEHPNIVRYYTTWREEAHWDDRSGYSAESSIQSDITRDSEDTSDEGDGSTYKTDQSDGSDSDHSDSDEKDQANLSATDSSSRNGDWCCLFIQMEFCEGGTLTAWIHENRRRTKEKALEIFQQLVQGVDYIHSKKLIHRDLKPDNILFGSEGIVKIGDFGLVTTFNAGTGESMYRTVDKGTPLYMSPEQEIKKKYNERTDIFSLAVIFFELLWNMSTEMEKHVVFLKLRKQMCPSDFCEQYDTEWKLIRKMLSENPASRPDTKQIADHLRLLRISLTGPCQRTV